MQLRVNAESAAFYRADHSERDHLDSELDQLLSVQKRLINRQLPLNGTVYVYIHITCYYVQHYVTMEEPSDGVPLPASLSASHSHITLFVCSYILLIGARFSNVKGPPLILLHFSFPHTLAV